MDYTEVIERVEAFEQRLELRLSALFADWDDHGYVFPYSYLKITGELQPIEGTALREDIKLIADVYDTSDRLVGHTEHHLYAERFFALETFEIGVRLSVPNLWISKIRLYPKPA